jgi:hypothetical protein
MSTYLLGFVLSDFEFEELRKPGETLQRVASRSVKGKTAKHVLEITGEVLKNLKGYLDFDFELGKLDSIAIPMKDTREFCECGIEG